MSFHELQQRVELAQEREEKKHEQERLFQYGFAFSLVGTLGLIIVLATSRKSKEK